MTGAEVDNKLPNPDNETVTDLLWDTLYSAEIRSAGQFKGLTQHVVDNWDAWCEWKNDDDPYQAKCPGDVEEGLSSFDKLVLIKVFRNEFIQRSMSTYIISEM